MLLRLSAHVASASTAGIHLTGALPPPPPPPPPAELVAAALANPLEQARPRSLVITPHQHRSSRWPQPCCLSNPNPNPNPNPNQAPPNVEAWRALCEQHVRHDAARAAAHAAGPAAAPSASWKLAALDGWLALVRG